MDNTLAVVVGAVVIVLIVFAIVIGKRLASGRVRLSISRVRSISAARPRRRALWPRPACPRMTILTLETAW